MGLAFVYLGFGFKGFFQTMALLGNLSLQTSFLYCNSNNLQYFPKPRPLCYPPLHTHSLEPIKAIFENRWAPSGGESNKSINILPPEPQKTEGLNFQSFQLGIPHNGLTLQGMDREAVPVKQKKVAVYWDLDNKPPKVRPFDVAMSVREMARRFGEVIDLSAYANRHAFTHVPQWVVEERRERKKLDFLESKGLVIPVQPYICGVCGRKCKNNVDLKKHFKQLHERERQKRLSRLNSLKGRRKAKFKEQYREKDEKYKNAAQNLLFPKVGYGLASELKRAGVYVKTVEDKPQAADAALKRQIQHSMTRGIDCLCIISDDSDFSEMLNKARNNNIRTVVLGDGKALKRYADLWLSWDQVATGNAWDEIDTVVRKWSIEEAVIDGIAEIQDTIMSEDYKHDLDESDSEIDQIAEEIVKAQGTLNNFGRVSAFSEDEQQMQTENEIENLERHSYDDDHYDDWDSDEDTELDDEEETNFLKHTS